MRSVHFENLKNSKNAEEKIVEKFVILGNGIIKRLSKRKRLPSIFVLSIFSIYFKLITKIARNLVVVTLSP